MTEFEDTRARAEAGDAVAQFNLGVMYADGRGVGRDDREAVRWYRLAADQGYADAQRQLEVMYRDGRGEPSHYLDADQLDVGMTVRLPEGVGTIVEIDEPYLWCSGPRPTN